MKAESQGQELASGDLSFLNHVIECIKKKSTTARLSDPCTRHSCTKSYVDMQRAQTRDQERT